LSEAKRAEVVVVTGASAGVGRAIARAYGRRGARVGLVARGRDGLEGAKRDVDAAGGQGLVVPADVAGAGQVEAAAQAIEEAFGPIDVWINNAMVSVFSPIVDTTAEEFRRVTEVTYLGYVHGTLSALRRMRPRDHGVIVHVGSALAFRGIPLQGAYCGAKHAIQGFTDSLRCELLHDGSRVRVVMVELPAMNTPQFDWSKTRLPRAPQPVPPIYQPEVAADAVVWAVDHGRTEMWVGLPTLLSIVGNRVAPRLLDRYLGRTGYESQQTDRPVEPDRADNLWAPVPGDHGAHGRFDDRAHASSLQVWATKRRRWLALASVTAVALAGLAAARGNGHARRAA
jgi:NAD(P)-dependent dehydrogenase (short-subunit alcohol dehydrogenase family)